MATDINTVGVKPRRLRTALIEFFQTLIGGRKQRWDVMRKLAMTQEQLRQVKPQQQQQQQKRS